MSYTRLDMTQSILPTRLFDLVDAAALRGDRRPCFTHGDRRLFASAYKKHVDALSLALVDFGLRRGEAVAIVAENRPEWNVVDMAVMQAGGVTLPLCVGLSAEDYIEGMDGVGVRLLFIEDEALLGRFRTILPQVASLQKAVLMVGDDGGETLGGWIADGSSSGAGAALERRRSLTSTDDVCTMAYTGCGTFRKYTHRQLLAEVAGLASSEGGRRRAATCNNALCTVYGRTRNYVCQYAGRTVEYPSAVL